MKPLLIAVLIAVVVGPMELGAAVRPDVVGDMLHRHCLERARYPEVCAPLLSFVNSGSLTKTRCRAHFRANGVGDPYDIVICGMYFNDNP